MKYVDVLWLSKLFEFIEILIMYWPWIGQTYTNRPILNLWGECCLLFDVFFYMVFLSKGMLNDLDGVIFYCLYIL